MIPLQLSTLETVAGVLFFAGAIASIVVGLFVGYRAVAAYRRRRHRSLLLFGVGLLLLVAVSKVVNLLLASIAVPATVVGAATELLRLAGALIVTYAIYDDAPSSTDGSHRATVVGPALLFGPLQSVSVEHTPTSVFETVFVAALAGVGTLLTYQAYRGFRRNDDRSMALFGAGLFLLTVGHAALKLTSTLAVGAPVGGGQSLVLVVAAASQAVDIAGLGLVFYAILR